MWKEKKSINAKIQKHIRYRKVDTEDSGSHDGDEEKLCLLIKIEVMSVAPSYNNLGRLL